MSSFRLLAITMLIYSLAILPNCGQKETSLQIKGSDTMVNLIQSLTEAYMKKNPQASISITGGGSGVGIVGLIDRNADIANASRAIKDKEIELAKKEGLELVPIVIALDGLALIVNQYLPINSLTLEEVARVYRGEVTNWKNLGGPDLEISLYGRTAASGTYTYFRDEVLKGDYSSKMKSMVGNSHIVEAVRKDKAGIGYVGIGCIVDEKGKVVSGLKSLKIAKNKEAVSPLDIEKVKLGTYPLTRPLYQYIINKPERKVLEFIRFELSKEGQELVLKAGFYPVNNKYMEENRKRGVIE